MLPLCSRSNELSAALAAGVLAPAGKMPSLPGTLPYLTTTVGSDISLYCVDII